MAEPVCTGLKGHRSGEPVRPFAEKEPWAERMLGRGEQAEQGQARMELCRQKLQAQPPPITYTPTSEVPVVVGTGSLRTLLVCSLRGLHEVKAEVSSGWGVWRSGLDKSQGLGRGDIHGRRTRLGGAGDGGCGPLPVPEGPKGSELSPSGGTRVEGALDRESSGLPAVRLALHSLPFLRLLWA